MRSHIGVVSQEPVLFEGSISENIRLGKVDATNDEIIEASQLANAHNFVEELPQVYLVISLNFQEILSCSLENQFDSSICKVLFLNGRYRILKREISDLCLLS